MSALIYTLLLLGGLWLTANLLHGLWVGIRRHRWEQTLSRDGHGVFSGAAAYTLGEGKTALLLLHGFADTPAVWQRLATHLARQGDFTCHALRLPGAAERSATAAQLSLPAWRCAIISEIKALRATAKQVWVVGHSLGGALAIDVALLHPELIHGIALFAPLIAVSRKRSPILPPKVWFGLARLLLSLSPTFESPFSQQGVALDDPSFSYTRDRFIPFAVYRALFKLIQENALKAPQVTHPIFAAVPLKESVVDPVATLKWLAQTPTTAHKTIIELPESGHTTLLEPGWRELTDNLADFIRHHH